jgi:hypothetical protein
MRRGAGRTPRPAAGGVVCLATGRWRQAVCADRLLGRFPADFAPAPVSGHGRTHVEGTCSGRGVSQQSP